MFQSTHPRRVWLWFLSLAGCCMVVSIHTPTQGVTCFCHQTKATSACFNPHTHAGCDSFHVPPQLDKHISIHTPTQGVTVLPGYSSEPFEGFNPHTHAGCDINDDDNDNPRYLFQSTHPRRVWLINPPNSLKSPLFQSTHPRRVWPSTTDTRIVKFEFQSTHPRRVWLFHLTGIC